MVTIKYKINELSKLLNIPASTIRYFEDVGLVHPERHSNSYRIFDTFDFMRLIEYKMFNSMGFSAKQISTMVNQNNLQENMAVYSDNVRRLRKELDYQTLLCDRLSEINQRIRMLMLNPGLCYVREEPDMYALHYLTDDNGQMGEINTLDSDLLQWINAFPFSHYYGESSISLILSGASVQHHLIMIEKSLAETLELPVKNARFIPARKYISMGIAFRQERYPSKEMLEKMLHFAEENAYLTEDTIRYCRLITGREPDTYHRYMELLIPLKA